MVVQISILEALGSVPRDVGTAMWVTREGEHHGTIGGGMLEYKAIDMAHRMLGGLDDGVTDGHVAEMPLGPATGQCCGGYVKLKFNLVETMPDADTDADGTSKQVLFLYGTGNVGSALIRALEPLPFALECVDARSGYRAEHRDYLQAARDAPTGAWHLIMTHCHKIDLAICEALLQSGGAAGHIGLIGSKTKRARFFKQLRAQGHDPSGIVCPIGIVGISGKEPEIIAASVAAELLLLLSSQPAKREAACLMA